MPGPESEPSAAVRALVLGPVDSFEKLELLIVLARSPEPLDVTTIMVTFGRRTTVVDYLIELLARAGVIVEASPGAWQLPRSGPMADAIAELVQLYDRRPAQVMNLLAEAALARLRERSARAFADAFVLRRGKKGDDDDG